MDLTVHQYSTTTKTNFGVYTKWTFSGDSFQVSGSTWRHKAKVYDALHGVLSVYGTSTLVFHLDFNFAKLTCTETNTGSGDCAKLGIIRVSVNCNICDPNLHIGYYQGGCHPCICFSTSSSMPLVCSC
jgi:hypothetical protein